MRTQNVTDLALFVVQAAIFVSVLVGAIITVYAVYDWCLDRARCRRLRRVAESFSEWPVHPNTWERSTWQPPTGQRPFAERSMDADGLGGL